MKQRFRVAARTTELPTNMTSAWLDSEGDHLGEMKKTYRDVIEVALSQWCETERDVEGHTRHLFIVEFDTGKKTFKLVKRGER
jgi:hypothetical protein